MRNGSGARGLDTTASTPATPMTMPSPATSTTTTSDRTSDIASLLTVVRKHQQEHADPTYDAATPTAIHRCKMMLSKLRKVLPKLMRPVATAPADTGVAMLHDLCEIVELLLRGNVCPHSMALFVEGSASATATPTAATAAPRSRASASPTASASTSSYPTFATMLFYMLSFYSTAHLRAGQASVLRVLLEMARFLEQHDRDGLLHVFRDTVDVLADGFLLEETLRVRESGNASNATIATYLSTAMHVYHNADGPLGAATADTLCGCEPIAGTDPRVVARRQQLKALLPPIHVATYNSAIELRRSMTALAQQLLLQSSAMLASDAAADRLVQLVQLFVPRDSALCARPRMRSGPSGRRVTAQDAVDVTCATLCLLETMLRVAATTERKFVRLALVFYESSTPLDPTNSALIAHTSAVLATIRDGQLSVSTFATEALWSPLNRWLERSVVSVGSSTRTLSSTDDQQPQTRSPPLDVWRHAMEIVAQYVRASGHEAAAAGTSQSRLAVLLDVFASVNVTTLDAETQVSIVTHVHYALAAPSLLLQFTHALVKALKSHSFELGRDGSLSSTSRKRTRGGSFVPTSATETLGPRRPGESDDALEAPDKLAQYVLDLVFFASGDAARDVVALTLALRIVLPFRDWLTKNVSRVEVNTIFRVVVQRVDSVMNDCLACSPASLSTDVFDFLVLVLWQLEDNEVAKYSAAFDNVVSVIETSKFFASEAVGVDSSSEAVAPLSLQPPWRQTTWREFMATIVHPVKPALLSSPYDPDKPVTHTELFTAAQRLDCASQVLATCSSDRSRRAVFVVLFLWSRARALKLLRDASTWHDARLWRTTSELMLQTQGTGSSSSSATALTAIAMAPLLVPLVSTQSKSSSEVVRALLEVLVAKRRQSNISDALEAVILASASALLCAGASDAETAPPSLPNETHKTHLSSRASRESVVCDCWQRPQPSKRLKIPATAMTAALLRDASSTAPLSIELQTLQMRWLASVVRHCQLDESETDRVLARFNDVLASALDDASSCRVVSDLVHDLEAHPAFVQQLIAPSKAHHTTPHERARSALTVAGAALRASPSSVSFIEKMNSVLTRVEETFDESMLRATLPMLGGLGCACDDGIVEHKDVVIWAMLRLATVWSRAHARRATVFAAAAHDQMHRIAVHHGTSWRKLCVGYPESCYFPLVDELLTSRTLRLFLRTFLSDVDASEFLFGSAPHVLPLYVVDQNAEMLETFMLEFNAMDDESSSGYDDGSEGDDLRNLTLNGLLLRNIEFVLKELIIHQVESDNNDSRMAEWEFLIALLPENSTTRDVISHSPLRLLNLVAWELGGSRGEAAKKAFKTISQYLSQDSEAADSPGTAAPSSSGSMLIPRQYFLAMMTELGSKIVGKRAGSSADKVRAIKSINQLFSLFASASSSSTVSTVSMAMSHHDSEGTGSGVMDPFVPKVMATLKIGLLERSELQDHAMLAWAKFLRMLSVKALESNFCSIVVSVLPCIGYDPAMILHEPSARSASANGAAAAPLCWNVDILEAEHAAQATTLPTDTASTNGNKNSNADKQPSPVAAAAAFGILKYLFIEKRHELKQAFPRIPLLPSVPALDAIYAVLLEEVGDPEHKPLGEYLVDLASYVNHWDMAVREMALTQLFRCLVVRGRELQALLENEGDLFVGSAVVDIVHSILQLARTESQESVKLLCARCLGALGAIDAARMPLSLLYESSASSSSSSQSSSSSAIVAKDKADARVEYSMKDLACVLIETWLVKELRAAPENTDSVAFAIQELLKFLAELTADPQHSGQNLSYMASGSGFHKSKATAVPVMPEWMKRRFERKDVLQFVEPYWSTEYSVSGDRFSSSGGRRQSGTGAGAAGDRSHLHANGDDVTLYERHGTSYEEWLVSWCKRLIFLSQPPERKIFWACETALSTCPQIARFLLPYLIQNVLRSGRHDVYEELKREVMAVLNDQDRGILVDDYIAGPAAVAAGGVSDHLNGAQRTAVRSGDGTSDSATGAFGDDSSRHHQCAQTIFSTIEELNEWVWNSEKKRRALSSSSASVQSAASARSVDMPSELEDQEKENLEEFLKGIPSRALSNAAFGIEAYARAIQYFEVYLRQQDHRPFAAPGTKETYSSWPVHLSLIAKNAFYLQQLYKSVDEPDALIGLATLRRLYEAQSHSSSSASLNESDARLEDGLNLTDLMHQIVDHEQLAQWEDALACYEQAIQEIQTVLASRAFVSTGAGDIHSSGTTLPRGLLADPQTDPERVKPELYSGMIGCLIQLGRLESALQHINGIVTLEPAFSATLFPYALECTWRLSRWELLSDLLSSEKKHALLAPSSSSSNSSVGSRLRGIDVSQLKLIRVLHSLHHGELDAFQRNLRDARLEVMGPLAAASAESYERAYPLLHKLHFLHEAEQGLIFLQTTAAAATDASDMGEKTARWHAQCPWTSRYDAMPTSLKYRDPILALRRVLLQEAGLKHEVSHYWLLQAKLARKAGYARTASSAVMHAEALDNQYALLEKAKLMVSQDRMYEALQLLEPVDIDASKLDFNIEDRHFGAKNLLLATNWMQASGQRQGKKVIARYEAVIQFDPKWEKGYFYLAKYYEYLLSVSHPETSGTSSIGDESSNAIVLDDVFRAHLIRLMTNYVLALQHGTKFVFQSLPRLLTLWFEYGELFYGNSRASASSKANKAMRHVELELSQSSAAEQLLTEITSVIHHAVATLPAYEWLVCFPQVTSRICHPNPVVVEGVKKIMVRVLGVYPTQAMWPLLGLSRSLNSQRRNRARDIVTNIQRQFVSVGQQEIANSFSEGMRLVEELISLAGHDPANQRKIHIRLSRIRSKILVPVQAALTTLLPASGRAPSDGAHTAFSPQAQIHIKAFSDKADVMMTKEKPKRIEVLGSDGRLYPFLCKREKTGDLRKDARMMEFNNMINKLLQKDGDGRRRKLRLRTYAVVCLNEESGLMEWVRNTKAMRQLIGQIHKTERGFIQPVRLTHDIKERFLGMQKKYHDRIPHMAEYYRRKILALPVFTPRFHQWFLNNFADPTAWFASRMTFSRSAAVWSMVGHIIGLGDRHGENILIDCTNGECVHVDFDCLFDKGLKLAKPEIVPFRLTPNMIDAFGLTGYEGVFRRVCEVTMHLLRENKETLRSVLESFIHDPLVEWSRKGKATQSVSTSAGGATGAGRSIADISTDRSKEETRIILKTIDDRLRGIYNLGDAIRAHVPSSHRNILPEIETLPLSVQGQVDKLIHEATSHENLAQMYIGWMPFL